MKTLRHICEDASKAFNIKNQSLEELARQWTLRDDKHNHDIVGFKIIEDTCLIIVSKLDRNHHHTQYFIHRYFLIGDTWQVSQDLGSSRFEELMEHMIKHYK